MVEVQLEAVLQIRGWGGGALVVIVLLKLFLQVAFAVALLLWSSLVHAVQPLDLALVKAKTCVQNGIAHRADENYDHREYDKCFLHYSKCSCTTRLAS